ncbi:MAG: ABC transporter ATP-binding protein [Betaproteobacteria bacterium HGW-Betaproteobacteria-5]|jgi:lipopolysaccharide transport system ATP-binding protein|nr:MAG: ABC transporter ATP-binding protein [Betaproteobacteria bacterium HGW-Betaproteobacteria-5]PKO30665.1 MAG: ABC transporter ATP-binding protein [Betaproteobacteria bacterium HGW-Betaproteobacteria-7]
MEQRLSLEHVSKSFTTALIPGGQAGQSTKLAVDDVVLEIRCGDRVGIVGPNGAGKSTLLHMIAGVSSPTSGRIDVQGKVTSILTLGVGLRDDLSGRENIFVDGAVQGKSRDDIDKVVEEVVAFAELGEFIDYPVRTYSTGMKARLAFSMITHLEPEILIIDEALSVGDAGFGAKATKKILDICNRGKIVIIVSHSMGSIRSMCNRCLWMDSGRIVMDGDPEVVTAAYIEAVRGADEAILLQRFKAFERTRSVVPGSRINSVELFNGSLSPARVLKAGEHSFLRIRGEHALSAAGGECQIRIVRLDDAVLLSLVQCVDQWRLGETNFGLEIDLGPLVLGMATYRLDVSLVSNDCVCAESSVVFEVIAPLAPTGGKPMLLYPMTLESSFSGALEGSLR